MRNGTYVPVFPMICIKESIQVEANALSLRFWPQLCSKVISELIVLRVERDDIPAKIMICFFCWSLWKLVTSSEACLPWLSCILLSLLVLGLAAEPPQTHFPQKHGALVHPRAGLFGGRRISPGLLLSPAPGSPECSESTGGVPACIANQIQECYAVKPSDSQPGFSWTGSGSISSFVQQLSWCRGQTVNSYGEYVLTQFPFIE